MLPGLTRARDALAVAGNRQPGMSNSLSGYSINYLDRPAPPKAVRGYSGNLAGMQATIGTVFGTFAAPEEPVSSDAFPNCHGAAPVPVNLVSSFKGAKLTHEGRAAAGAFRMPGYAGHLSGHQHVAGKSHSAISCGDAGRTDRPNFGTGAPGMSDADQHIVSRNLLPGVTLGPDSAGVPPRTKMGYMGHLPGKHYSTNFGKSFAQASVELLAANGRPAAGGIPDPGRPFIADTDAQIAFPNGHVGRPQRSLICVAGYAGFRPRTTPLPAR